MRRATVPENRLNSFAHRWNVYFCLVLGIGVFGLAQRTDGQANPASHHVAGRGMHWKPVTVPLSARKVGSTALLSGGSGALNVDSLNMTGGATDVTVCANACFSAQYEQSTVPYYSLDVARNVKLIYSSATATARPVIFADVHISPSSTKTLVEYDLQAFLNGAMVTFLNGNQTLRFTAPSPQTTEVRLAGQFDNSAYPTELDDVTVVVTAVYSDMSSDQTSLSSVFVGVNTNDSYAGRGWIIGGYQYMYLQGSTGYSIINNGDGSMSWFAPLGSGTYLTESDGDFSVLTSTGSGSSLTYKRTYPDSSYVVFDYAGGMLRAVSGTGDTTETILEGGALAGITDPFRTYGGGSSHSAIRLNYDTTSAGSLLLKSIVEPGATGIPGTGRMTRILMNTDSTLAGIVDPDGDTTKFRYNSNKLLTMVINRRGDTTRYAYDPHSWLLDSIIGPSVPIDAGGGTTTLKHPITTLTPWQTIGVPITPTGSSPATPVLESAVKATITDPAGRKQTYTVTDEGRDVATTLPTNQTSTVMYDTSWTSLPIRVTYPDGHVDSVQYMPGTPNVTVQISTGDSALYYHYGVNGQVDSTWGAGGLATRTFYNATTGLVDSVREGGSSALVTHYTYNSARRLTQTKDVSGHLTVYHYDSVFGNQDSTNVPGGGYASVKFDAFGRDTLHLAKGAPYPIRTVYDTLNRVIKSWSKGATGDTVATTYDAMFVTRTKVPLTTRYKTDNDALGRVIKRYDGFDTTKYTSYRYDLAGRVTSWTNRRAQRVDVQYDSLDRVVQQSGTNLPTDVFTYSSNGLVQTASRSGVSLDSTFVNVSGDVDSTVHRINGHRYRFAATSASGTNMTQSSTTITSDVGIHWVQPSAVSRYGATSLDSVTLSPGAGGGAMVTTTNADGVPTQVQWPSSVPTRTTSYTARQLPYRVGFSGTGAFQDSMARDYLRDTLGRLTNVWRKSGTGYNLLNYTYDGLGRLTKRMSYQKTGCATTTDSILGAVYSCGGSTLLSADSTIYDAAGNPTVTGATYSTTGNRMLTFGGITYTYDADGNIATRSQSGVYDTLYWNAVNQLDSVHSTGTRRTRYEYNSAGYPVRRSTAGAVDRVWLWEGDQLQAELDATGSHRIAQYFYEGTDQPTAIATDSAATSLVRYMQRDQIGNVIGISRGSAVVQGASYLASGAFASTPYGTIADTNRLFWKGLMYEGNDTRWYFVRHRWYDPQISRFVNEDPIGLQGGDNVYLYANNDPINGSDPTGLYVCFSSDALPYVHYLQEATGMLIYLTAMPYVAGVPDNKRCIFSLQLRQMGIYTTEMQRRLTQLKGPLLRNIYVGLNSGKLRKGSWTGTLPEYVDVNIDVQQPGTKYSVLNAFKTNLNLMSDCAARKTGVIDMSAIMVHEILGHAYKLTLSLGLSVDNTDSFAIAIENQYHLSRLQPQRDVACYNYHG